MAPVRSGNTKVICDCGCYRLVSRATRSRHNKEKALRQSGSTVEQKRRTKKKVPKTLVAAPAKPQVPAVVPAELSDGDWDEGFEAEDLPMDTEGCGDDTEGHGKNRADDLSYLDDLDAIAERALLEAQTLFQADTILSDDIDSEDMVNGKTPLGATIEDTQSGREGTRDQDDDGDDPLLELDDGDDDGITEYERLGEKFEREIHDLEEKISSEDIKILKAFAFKLKAILSKEDFKLLPLAFEGALPPGTTADRIDSRTAFLSGLDPVLYHCCPKLCCCYVGPYADLESCPHCKTSRFSPSGHPRKIFTYIPLIRRLQALAQNPEMAKKMKYRAEYKPSPRMHKDGEMRECEELRKRMGTGIQGRCYCPTSVNDMFDASLYQSLLDTPVSVGGKQLRHQHFSGDHDISLGLSTDGFAPFKKARQTAWPIILYNYNIPPKERFHQENLICVGVVPGPKKPQNFDSFLWPLIQELHRLKAGVKTFSALRRIYFLLRAYLILVGGDIPAISMIMRMKGHNAICPCRMCIIKGIRIPNSCNPCHYIPLDRSHPSLTRADPSLVRCYDPAHLPLRSHHEMVRQGQKVQEGPTAAEKERLSKEYGIKGVPLLGTLSSISLPASFPYDFMHLLWENVIPNLIQLWTGEFKNLTDTGSENYDLEPTVWNAIGEATSASGATIPSTFGSRPRSISTERHTYTADIWSFWTLYIGPVVLNRRFKAPKYYDHFVRLVKLLHLCLKFELSSTDLESIRVGFIEWVETYERYYYQNSPNRLSTCPITVHALLHIADSIMIAGPVWAYWAFPMERFCGVLGRHIKGRRFPYANIDSYVVASARLMQISLQFNLMQELSLKRPLSANTHTKTTHRNYPYTLSQPAISHHQLVNHNKSLILRVEKYLCTRYGIPITDVRRWMKCNGTALTAVRRARHLNGGDTVIAAATVASSRASDRRSASSVRYLLLVDQHTLRRRVEPEFELRTFYGRVDHILIAQLPSFNQAPPTVLFLADIHPFDIVNDYPILDLHFFSKMATHSEVVDLSTVQCLVGLVPLPRIGTSLDTWGVIDRSGDLGRELYDPGHPDNNNNTDDAGN